MRLGDLRARSAQGTRPQPCRPRIRIRPAPVRHQHHARRARDDLLDRHFAGEAQPVIRRDIAEARAPHHFIEQCPAARGHIAPDPQQRRHRWTGGPRWQGVDPRRHRRARRRRIDGIGQLQHLRPARRDGRRHVEVQRLDPRPRQRRSRRGRGEAARNHQIGPERDHLLGGAAGRAEPLRYLLRYRAGPGIARIMADRRNPLGRDQLNQHRIGAGIDRDDPAPARRRHGAPCEREGKQGARLPHSNRARTPI